MRWSDLVIIVSLPSVFVGGNLGTEVGKCRGIPSRCRIDSDESEKGSRRQIALGLQLYKPSVRRSTASPSSQWAFASVFFETEKLLRCGSRNRHEFLPADINRSSGDLCPLPAGRFVGGVKFEAGGR